MSLFPITKYIWHLGISMIFIAGSVFPQWLLLKRALEMSVLCLVCYRNTSVFSTVVLCDA